MTSEQEKRLEEIRSRHEKTVNKLERTGRLQAIESADDRARLLAMVDDLREGLRMRCFPSCERDSLRAKVSELAGIASELAFACEGHLTVAHFGLLAKARQALHNGEGT